MDHITCFMSAVFEKENLLEILQAVHAFWFEYNLKKIIINQILTNLGVIFFFLDTFQRKFWQSLKCFYIGTCFQCGDLLQVVV